MSGATIPLDPFNVGLLVVAGVGAGVVNVLAGGGSFFTLPVLIFLGLPPTVANGTNRVGILAQNVAATWSFRRQGVVEPGAWRWAAGPATVGAVGGVALASVVGDLAFERILAVLMIVVTVWTLWGPRATPGEERWTVRQRSLAFVAVGVYGGFVQAGVGFFVLTVTSFAGLDLVRGNGVKVVTILCFTVVSLGLFAVQGLVVWWPGLCLAVGTVFGGVIGARLTVVKGHRWVRVVVTVAAIGFAVGLLLRS